MKSKRNKLVFGERRKKENSEDEKSYPTLFTHILRVPSLWRSCSESLKVKENVFLLLNSIRARGGGFTRRALGSSMTESPLLRLSAAVTHFNSTLFLSHWKPSTMTFNKGRRVKTWLFLHILSPRLGRGPSKGINQCSLTALPSGNDLSLFCAQKWHINLKMDMHKLYIQLQRLCLRSTLSVKQPHKCKRPASLHMDTQIINQSLHAKINISGWCLFRNKRNTYTYAADHTSHLNRQAY